MQVVVFIALHLWALWNVIFYGHLSKAIAMVLPTILLRYAWTMDQGHEIILGIPFRFLLPYQGPRYLRSRFSPQLNRSIKGPARDAYANCFYILPLYLTLWYSYIGTAFPEDSKFFVIIAFSLLGLLHPTDIYSTLMIPMHLAPILTLGFYLFIWWLMEVSVKIESPQSPALTSQLWAITNGVPLCMACISLLLILNVWLGPRTLFWLGSRQTSTETTFFPHGYYWDDSAPELEILAWEMLERQRCLGKQIQLLLEGASDKKIEEFEAVKLLQADEQRRRRSLTRVAKLESNKAFSQDEAADPSMLYREDSPDPAVLHRGYSSDDENVPQFPQSTPKPQALAAVAPAKGSYYEGMYLSTSPNFPSVLTLSNELTRCRTRPTPRPSRSQTGGRAREGPCVPQEVHREPDPRHPTH